MSTRKISSRRDVVQSWLDTNRVKLSNVLVGVGAGVYLVLLWLLHSRN
jgi:hypothetical protein